MLYPFQVISEEPVSIPRMSGLCPAAGFLETAHLLSELFGETPAVLYRQGGAVLTLLFRDVAYLWRDIVDAAGAPAAAVSGQWPLRFYGTTESRETAELTLLPQGKKVAARLRSVSGRAFDHLQGLGIQAECRDARTAAGLASVAQTDPFLSSCAVLPRGQEALLHGSDLLAAASGSRFSYLAWTPLPPPQLLYALTAAHKLRLWREFLLDGLQPSEFDWLWESYYTGEALYLLEWELTLRAALDGLGFQVERTDACFAVSDREGRRRRFDFARGGPAEKLFLKLLFPLDTK